MKPKQTEDAPSIRGGWLSEKQKRLLAVIESTNPDPLAKEIVRLRALHPALRVAFRDSDLSAMDHETLKLLYDDIRQQLKIA